MKYRKKVSLLSVFLLGYIDRFINENTAKLTLLFFFSIPNFEKIGILLTFYTTDMPNV